MILSDALDRTLLLMRDEVGDAPSDDVLIEALTSTSVALVVDEANISSHAAQSAFITAALLMARSAHRVFLIAPETTLLGAQPPLPPGPMLQGLVQVGRNLLPGIAFTIGEPEREVDLVVAFGDTPLGIPARRRIRVSAEPWTGSIVAWNAPRRWTPSWWPMGGLAVGALAAGEAFKQAMHKLLPYALNPQMTASIFALSDQTEVQLAPPQTSFPRDLGDVDFISGGAINSSALYAISRVPRVRLRGRIIEPDTFAPSNLNRYALMLASHDGLGKAETLSGLLRDILKLGAVPARYLAGSPVEPLAGRVVVGVDDIPTRWNVQRAGSSWLTIGATTHWSAMASFHASGLGCAQCLHPEDEPGDAPIPTQACVSFWAGLHTAAYLIRHAALPRLPVTDQHVYMTPFRPEHVVGGAVRIRPGCPTCGTGMVHGEPRAA